MAILDSLLFIQHFAKQFVKSEYVALPVLEASRVFGAQDGIWFPNRAVVTS